MNWAKSAHEIQPTIAPYRSIVATICIRSAVTTWERPSRSSLWDVDAFSWRSRGGHLTGDSSHPLLHSPATYMTLPQLNVASWTQEVLRR